MGIAFGYANIVAKNLVQLVYTPMLLSFVGKTDYDVFQTSNSFVFSLQLLSLGLAGTYLRSLQGGVLRRLRDGGSCAGRLGGWARRCDAF